MSRSKEWKAKRAHVLPGRMEYCKRILRESRITEFKETPDGNLLIFYKGICIRYSPFTGYYTGKGLKPGRGIEELLSEL